MDRSIKFVAELDHVREVSLIGLANLGFWRDLLAPERFAPVDVDGRAQMVISGTNARFRGVRFRELCFGIRAVPTEATSPREGLFLPAAFHSSRFFGWIERYFFSAPYQYAKVDVDATPAPEIELRNKFDPVLRLQLGLPAGRAPHRQRTECWEGPVYLPRKGDSAEKKWFFARLSGETKSYRFDSSHDAAWWKSWDGQPILQNLIDSEFTPTDWMVREDARHAKSKTYSGPFTETPSAS